MTVFNVHAGKHSGVAVSDTAVYAPDGTIIHFVDKLNVVEHLKAVVMVRGHWQAGEFLAFNCGDIFSTFDDLIADAEKFIPAFHQVYADKIDILGDNRIDVSLLGWSEKNNRSEGYNICSYGSPDGSVAPFTLRHFDFLMAPNVAPERLAMAGLIGPAGLTKAPSETLVEVAEIQRKTIDTYRDNEVYIIGGDLLMATVTERGVSKRKIKSWGDKAGEMIDPFAGSNVTPIATLNRHQRRALGLDRLTA